MRETIGNMTITLDELAPITQRLQTVRSRYQEYFDRLNTELDRSQGGVAQTSTSAEVRSFLSANAELTHGLLQESVSGDDIVHDVARDLYHTQAQLELLSTFDGPEAGANVPASERNEGTRDA